MEVLPKAVVGPRNSVHHVGLQRQHNVTEDEFRLLGVPRGRRDPGETAIPIPGRNRTPNALGKLGIPRGPQPKNTLSQTPRTLRQGQATRVLANIPASNNRGIQVEIVRGDNVAKNTKALSDFGVVEERPAKRRKTGGPTPVEQDSQPAGSDGIDELGLQQEIIPSVIRDSQRTSQTNSFLSQENERPKAYFGTEEFRNVENTMNSNPNRKSKGKRRNHSSPTGAVSGNDRTRLLESKATSAASPINLSDDEEVRTLPSVTTHQIKYQGTANGAHKNFLAEKKSMPSLPVQDTGRTSRHFIQSADAITKHSSAVIDSLDSQSQRDVEMEADRLDNKFRAANGKARSQDFASSPDVLSGDTTVGAVLRQDSPTKSSSSTRKGSPVKESQPPLPPSNISGSAFVGAIRQSKGTASTRRDQSAQESDAPWGIRLAAVSVQDCMYRSTTLGLQHRADLEAYDVIDGGKNWADQSLSFRVLLAKLRKVTWSKTGRMVRFESAKSEGADNVLDIELCNEKDLTTLAKKIQEKYHPFKIIGEEEDQMRRKFDNRITQQKSHKISKTSKSIEAVDEGQEIELLVKRKARRDAAEATQEQTATDQKRRRVDSRMVDQMKGGANSSAVIEYPWGRSRSGEGISKEPFHNPHQMIDKASPDQGSANSRPQSPSKISVILSKFKSKNLTAQATYSTRSKSEKDPSTPQALPSVLDEPRPQRYSKTHDMGKQWTKPLTYPKIGKKKAFIEWKDLERLDEGEFFNDTLIEFYLRYLQHQLEIERPQLAKKIYFFNTFFFKNLTHKGGGQRQSNYELVAKWTRGLDIFDHDYVVVPINEACHWYLVIICNLPNLNRHPPPLDGDPTSPSSDKIDPALRNDGEGRPNLSRACSPSLDEAETPKEKDARTSFAELSLEHSQEKTKVIQGLGDASDVKPNADDQEMLDTQLKEDIADAAEQTAPRADGNSTLHASAKKKGKRKSLPPGRKLDPGQPAIVTFDSLTGTHPSTVRVIKDYLIAEAADKRGGMKFDEKQIKGMNAIGIPKQDNYCDCGPFLLGYMAKFVEDPKGFMSKAMQKQFDVDKDWPTLVPSKLRANIRDLMFQLYREQEDDKRESAKKTGKYIPSVAKKAEPSPTGGAPQTQPVEDPSTKTAREATKQVSRSTSPSPATRKEALENAIPIDAADVPKARTSVTDSPKATRQDPTLGKEQSFIVIDSQSQPHSRPGDEPSPVHPADELPSTIEDSQPVDSLQALEDSMAGTPPQSHYEGPPEPASSPLEAKGVSSPTWSPDADRTLRSSPRSSTKKARKKEKTNKREVVELD